MVKVKWILLIIVAVLLLTSPDVKAEFVVEEKETLHGIKAIFLFPVAGCIRCQG